MPKQYKLGDKVFNSTGDVNQDIAIIRENFPEVDTSALEQSFNGVEGNSEKVPFLKGVLRRYGTSLTGGLVNPALAGAGAVAGKVGEVFGGDEIPISERYSNLRDEDRQIREQFQKESPVGSFTADIAGLATPQGLFGRLYKGTQGAREAVTALPFLKRVLQGSKLARGAEAVAGTGLRGGLSNAAYQGLNPDSETDVGTSFLEGAGGDLAATGVVGSVTKSPEVAKGLYRGAKELAKEVATRDVPGMSGLRRFLEGRSKEKFSNQLGEIAGKYGSEDVVKAGTAFSEGVSEISDEAFRKYKAIKDPILKKLGDEAASPESLRQKILSELDSAGVVDGKGNIDYESIVFSGPEGSLYRRLAKDLETLGQNPSLKELDRVIRGYGTLANFGKKIERTSLEKTFGKLWGAGRDDLLGNAENLLIEAEKASPQIKSANKLIQNEAKQGSFLQGKLKQPLVGERLKTVLSEDLNKSQARQFEAQTTRDAEIAAAEGRGVIKAEDLRKARQEFAQNQDVLGRLRPLANKDPEKVISSARSQLTGSFIEDALSVSPQYADPLKKAVMADIFQKSSSPKLLAKALNTYRSGPLKKLFGEDYDALARLAGIFQKDPGASQKIVKAIGNATKEERELLLRSPAALLSFFQQKQQPAYAIQGRER